MNKPFLDLFKIPEDERILMIGSSALHTVTGILLERDQPEKVARYIMKVTGKFPGVRHLETIDGPHPLMVLVKFGPTAAQSHGVNLLNRAPVIDQLEGQWEKIVALLMWKLNKGALTSLTAKDIEAYHASELVLFAHGHADGFSFRLVTHEEAQHLAENETSNRGRA